MDSIGGYFELEINDHGSVFHDKAVAINSGRNALEYILLVNNYKKIYLPYYTCDAILQPITKLNIDFEFYSIDNSFNPKLEVINENEVLLYVNYFGLFNKNTGILKNKYTNFIVDNSQAFYALPLTNTPTFYSPRKFFGIPDGGFVYVKNKLNFKLETDISKDRLSHLITRIEEGAKAGFDLFKANDSKLGSIQLKKMSKITKQLLLNINFMKSCEIRNDNFIYLHAALQHKNKFSKYIELEHINGPMVYPLLTEDGIGLRKHLINNKIFTAKYWPNVTNWVKKNSLEYFLVENLVAIPIDQRYTENDMNFILNIINNY